MILTKIEYKGFRCFSDYSLDFKRGVNLLIGDNGSGKTSVIRGVVLALNAFFKGFSDENTSCAGIASDDFNHSVANESKSLTRQVEIVFTTEGNDEEVSIFRESKKASTTYKNAKEFNGQNKALYYRVAEEDGNNRSTPLPLIAFFATDDIHSKVGNVNGKAFKDYYLTPSFGYYFCLKGGFLAKHWINRMLVLKEGGKGEEELTIVVNMVICCPGNISNNKKEYHCDKRQSKGQQRTDHIPFECRHDEYHPLYTHRKNSFDRRKTEFGTGKGCAKPE